MKLRQLRRLAQRRMKADAPRREMQHAANRVVRSMLDAFEAGTGFTRAYVEACKRELIRLMYRQVVRPVVLKAARSAIAAGPLFGGVGGPIYGKSFSQGIFDDIPGSSATLDGA